MSGNQVIILLIICGILCIIPNAIACYKRLNIVKNSEKTEAMIIEFYVGFYNPLNVTFVSLEYRVNGEDYKSSVQLPTRKKFFVGDKIMILYHRKAPKRIIIANYNWLYALTEAVRFIPGVLFIAASIYIKFTGI